MSLADELERLCCAETEGKFFDLVTDNIGTIVSALREIERRAWKPIETAPKDGTPVQLYFPKRYQGNGGVSWGCFVAGEWLDSRAVRDNDASHWAPMPAPPTIFTHE